MPLILPPKDGFLLLDRDKFHGSFAADLPAEQAAFMADSQGVCCVVPTCGVLKARHTSRSDCDRELGEGDRHSPVHWLLGGQLVVASPKILDEAMPSDDHPGTAVLLEPLHRS